MTVSPLVRRSRLPLPWNVMLLLFSKAALFCRLAIGAQPALCTCTQARGNEPVSLPSSLFSLSLSSSLALSLSSLLFLTLTCQARVLLNDFERNTQPLIQASWGKASRLFLCVFVVAALGKGRKSERQPAGGRPCPWKTAPENSLREARIQRK